MVDVPEVQRKEWKVEVEVYPEDVEDNKGERIGAELGLGDEETYGGNPSTSLMLNPRQELSEASLERLEEALKSCQELMELEPDAKWPLLTSVFLMRALDTRRYLPDILESLLRLQDVDPLRKNCYGDTRSEILVEESFWQPLGKEKDLGRNSLTRIPHQKRLCLLTSLDLRGNSLSSLHWASCLQSCRTLNLDDNLLQSLEGLEACLRLCDLSVCRNRIQDVSGVVEPLKKLPLLISLCLAENPFCRDECWAEKIKGALPALVADKL